jgi:alkaline phosphatase
MAHNISDFYQSQSIQQHFESRRARALAFLQTVGAKALVLVLNSHSHGDTLEGLNDEYNWKMKMARDAALAKMKRDLLDIEGVVVSKRARNCALRTINLR